MSKREEWDSQHPIVREYGARDQENEYQQAKAGEATRGSGVPSRTEWNELHPVTDHYTTCHQGKEYVAAHPATAGNEPPVPKMCERMNLSIDEAIAEYKELQAAPSPQYGWNASVTTQIQWRYDQLKTIVFNHILEGEHNGN